jgi:hypothetical protein
VIRTFHALTQPVTSFQLLYLLEFVGVAGLNLRPAPKAGAIERTATLEMQNPLLLKDFVYVYKTILFNQPISYRSSSVTAVEVVLYGSIAFHGYNIANMDAPNKYYLFFSLITRISRGIKIVYY